MLIFLTCLDNFLLNMEDVIGEMKVTYHNHLNGSSISVFAAPCIQFHLNLKVYSWFLVGRTFGDFIPLISSPRENSSMQIKYNETLSKPVGSAMSLYALA